MLKTIIFDFDQTMYIGNVGNTGKIWDKSLFMETFEDGAQKYEMLIKKYEVNKKDIKDLVDICFLEGLDGKKLSDNFSQSVFQHIIKDKIELLPNSFFRELAKHYSLYVVSMSQKKYLNFYFNKYQIDVSVFKDVVCMDLIKNKSKGDLFEKIMKQENNKSEEMLVIGDSYSHDIQPAKMCGSGRMQTLHFNQHNFNQIYDFLSSNNILDCEKFKADRKFFPSEK